MEPEVLSIVDGEGAALLAGCDTDCDTDDDHGCDCYGISCDGVCDSDH